MHCVDLSRKRVWLGISLPGAKMIELATTANMRPLFRGERFLVESYQGPAWKGLLCTAICLHYLPERPAAGRAAVLADTRDFLKLRYRARGLDEPSAAELLEDLADGSPPEELAPERPDLAINYLVSALDALSGCGLVVEDGQDLTVSAHVLRDISEQTGRRLAEDQYSSEDWGDMAPRWHDAVLWQRLP